MNIFHQEIQKIEAEINELRRVQKRLEDMDAVVDGVSPEPKKRSYTRKKKVGLPEAKEVA